MKEFDVIVVGASVAGLRSAEQLAKRGLKVLCLDKKQEVGNPKQCGEGLGLGHFNRLGIKPLYYYQKDNKDLLALWDMPGQRTFRNKWLFGLQDSNIIIRFEIQFIYYCLRISLFFVHSLISPSSIIEPCSSFIKSLTIPSLVGLSSISPLYHLS